MIHTSRTHALRLLCIAAVGIAAANAVNIPVGAASDTPASFTIDAVSGATVASDAGAYIDYRLIDGGASSPPICVDSLISPTGTIFNRLNREIADGLRCGEVGGTARNFLIAIENPLACSELASYGVGLTDPSGVNAWPGTGSCILTHVDSPRIRVGKTFGSKVTKTDIAFLIKMLTAPAGHGGFEIQPFSAAPVSAVGTSRVVSYSGQANLVKFGTGTTKPAAVRGAEFNLTFRITFAPSL